MTQQSTADSTGPVRPGRRSGQASEFTIIFPLKPGGAERTRELLRHLDRSAREMIETLDDSRMVFFDNDTRMLFPSTFDGDWDSYIDDFASKTPDQLDTIFGEAEGYPGPRDPGIKDYIVKYQVEADEFYSAYPDATVKQIRKGQRVLKAWEELLDTAAE
jgi:hypothetical protein